jgi:hypothetical protein
VFLGRGWRYFTAVVDIDLAPPPKPVKPVTKPSGKPTTKAKPKPAIKGK